ncbi:MAG: ligand-binding sensor domain-containing protein [Pyrinomonadaceae bacterium]
MQNGEIKNAARNLPDAPAFQRLTDDDGLSQNSVRCILQDGKGFIWFGTLNGLNRFDGYQFVIYRHDFQDQNSLSDNLIHSIYETASGEIWVGTSNGLNRYEQATDNFKTYTFDANNPKSLGDGVVQTIFADRDGTLWVGTSKGGLSKFDRAAESFTHYQTAANNDESLSSNNVRGIGEDKDGGFWVATNDGGLNKFDRETGRFARYQVDKNNPNRLSSNQIQAMLIDRAGVIWLGTFGGGLNKFDPHTERFTHYLADANDPHSLNDNRVFSIYETPSDTLWVGTKDGLNRYAKETDSFTVYQHDPTNPRSLSFGEIWSIYEDDTEQLWVGSSFAGVNKFNQKTGRFHQFKHDRNNPNSISNGDILAIYEDRNKTLWIGTRAGGLNRYNSETRRFEAVKSIGSTPVINICEDREGKLWFGTEGDGLFYFDRAADRFTKFQDPNNPSALGTSIVSKIYQDRDGFLWLGTKLQGLYKLDQATQKLTRYQHDPNNPASLSDNTVRAILEDGAGVIWIGTDVGLNKFDQRTETFSHLKHAAGNHQTPSADGISAIYEDTNGTLWFGTSSGGLNRFDRRTETFTYFTEREGLPNNQVYDIFADEQSHLWLSTDKGLARLNPATNRFRNFDVNDGLTHNEFNHKAAFKSANGEMYFGGFNGFVRFNPKDFADSDFQPPIVLTDIRVLEQPLKTERNITELKELNLSWRDYVVSFEFAALDFTDPKKLQYQWRLEGFDTDWIHGGTRRTATYTNLPGGAYVLKVRATNVDGVWTDAALKALKINVTPPFYSTFWFFGLIALAIGVFVWLVYRNQINQLRKISEAQTRFTQQLITSQEAERKRIAAELHDSLGQHLVIIKNRALLGLNKGDDRERVARELSSISESASQALEEVREITNNLRPQLLDRLGLTKAIKALCKKVSGVIEIESEIDSIDNLFSEIEEISIYRIVQESLNNIIKHSNASDAIVTIKRDERKVSITIEDNGQGFAVGNVKSDGGGLGLVGLTERAQLLGGELVIETKLGEGTKIRVALDAEACTQ